MFFLSCKGRILHEQVGSFPGIWFFAPVSAGSCFGRMLSKDEMIYEGMVNSWRISDRPGSRVCKMLLEVLLSMIY